MVTLNMESRNPMGRVYAENCSKTQKLLGVKGLIYRLLAKFGSFICCTPYMPKPNYALLVEFTFENIAFTTSRFRALLKFLIYYLPQK